MNHCYGGVGMILIVYMSIVSLLKFSSHANDLSTIHRLGITLNLDGPSFDLSTISNSHPNLSKTQSARFPSIATVSKYFGKTRKFVRQVFNNLRSSLAVVNIGFMYGYSHQIALSINYYMLFSALDFLVAIKPSIIIHMVRCLDTTGVNDA